uniref:Uncharacterized protein n=1 Tax=Nyssomyia neivai TaxID=330878 RepID=A0A1L8D7X2_9DIPT
MKALVFAGLPTTSTFTSLRAYLSRAAPCTLKIFTFAARRSLRSIPSLRGIAPTRNAAATSLNATAGSSVAITFASSGNAQSSSSITTPPKTPIIGGMSKRCKIIFCCRPKTSPLAIICSSEYPICPAAPVTTTRIGSQSAIL